ncbi:hypothetical protein NDK43_25045 [Neobacillus pocheonensis]|uniref:DUF600 family protein n=1 Tax=Neobacillus pocheonensis TaxID=363869 RepID=A0ABT0WG07_9BACI|nr:hypothetical protein [Neobacillus pocheonensis]
MINLDKDKVLIERFWTDSIKKFNMLNPDVNVYTVGLYCCRWAGWMTINFDTNPNSENCPDFTYVAFESLDFEHWQDDYDNNETLEILLNGNIQKINLEEDEDERINEVVFTYLKTIVKEPHLLTVTNILKKKEPFRVGIQMLDSSESEFWTL